MKIYQNLQVVAKVVLRENFITLNICNRKVSDQQSVYLKKPKKEEQNKI